MRAGVGVLYNTEGIRYEPKYVVSFIISVQVGVGDSQPKFCFYIYKVFIDLKKDHIDFFHEISSSKK